MRIQGKVLRSLAAGVLAAVAFMAASPSAQAGSDDDERVVGAIVGSVIGGVIGSTIGNGADRGVAIGIGSLLGGIAGYHAVDPDPRRHHRRGHRHARYRRHVHYDYDYYPPPRPRVYVHPRRERHVHHHYYEAPQPPQTVVTYQLPAPVVAPAAPVREVNVVMAPPRGGSRRVLDTALTECKVLESGIAPVYACRTAGGDWRLLK